MGVRGFSQQPHEKRQGKCERDFTDIKEMELRGVSSLHWTLALHHVLYMSCVLTILSLHQPPSDTM